MAVLVIDSLVYDNENQEFNSVHLVPFASTNTDWEGELARLTVDGQRTLTISSNAWLFTVDQDGNRVPVRAYSVKPDDYVCMGKPHNKAHYPTVADEQLWDMGIKFAVNDDVLPTDVLKCLPDNLCTFVNGFATHAKPVHDGVYKFSNLRAAQFFSMAATKARSIYAAVDETACTVTLPPICHEQKSFTARVCATQRVHVNTSTPTWKLQNNNDNYIINGFLVKVD